MAGRLQTQKRKKLTKSRVFVPEPAGMLLGRSAYFVQMDRIMSVTHSPARVSWRRLNLGSRNLTSDPCLHAVPNASHRSAVEHWPQRSPDTE